MVAKSCGMVTICDIDCGILCRGVCHEKGKPNHHTHPNATSIVAQIRLFLLMFLPLLLPILAYALTGIGETLNRSIFGSGAVIAFGKRVFLFLAIRSFAGIC